MCARRRPTRYYFTRRCTHTTTMGASQPNEREWVSELKWKLSVYKEIWNFIIVDPLRCKKTTESNLHSDNSINWGSRRPSLLHFSLYTKYWMDIQILEMLLVSEWHGLSKRNIHMHCSTLSTQSCGCCTHVVRLRKLVCLRIQYTHSYIHTCERRQAGIGTFHWNIVIIRIR